MANPPSRMLMCNAEQRAALMRVALGTEPADMVILNGSVVNVYTGEILENCPVAVKGKWIASVGPDAASAAGESTLVVDAAGKTLAPGLIDGHTHTWFNTLDAFLPYVIKGGTTTIITETMEFYPVGGYDGVIEFLDSLKDQPIKFFATAPAMVSISKNHNGIPGEILEKLLERDEIVGLGESYWQAVLQSPDTMVPLLQSALDRGKRLEGHSAGARGKKLMAYAASGISSCHEPITAEEAIALLRLGIHVMVREGSVRKELEQISSIRHAGVDLRRLLLVTDSIEPEELVEKGYLEVAVQKAISCGFDPVSAIQMATLNVAEHFGLDDVIGGIAPGRCADILVLPDVKTIAPETVISNGRIVFKDAKLIVPPRKHHYPDWCRQSIQLQRPMKPSDFEIHADKASVRVRVIEMISDLVTKELQTDVFPTEGKITADLEQGIVKVAVIDCRHDPCRSFVGLIKGFGITQGSIACSAPWDTSGITVVGANEEDMALAVNRIRELQGGVIVCKGGKILAELPLPIFGIMSDLDMEQVAKKLNSVRQAARGLGITFADPVLTLETLTGAAIPHLRICEEGLVSLRDGKTLTLEVK
ncbi:Ade: adenine deaminase [Syntrophobacter sp. SbD1]|nr:Ade: adenine deaminase [Syntrophobacter sp. SbD1]